MATDRFWRRRFSSRGVGGQSELQLVTEHRRRGRTTAKYEIFVTTRLHLWSFRYQAQDRERSTQVWSKPIDEVPASKSYLEPTPAIGDVDGDGMPDVVIGTGLNRLLAVNARTGTTLHHIPEGTERLREEDRLGDPGEPRRGCGGGDHRR